MLDVKYLRKKCPDGIPFSECKKLLQQENKKKKTKRKGARSPSRKRRRRSLTRKRTKSQKIPPKGVIYRTKSGKYKKSTGSKLQDISW